MMFTQPQIGHIIRHATLRKIYGSDSFTSFLHKQEACMARKQTQLRGLKQQSTISQADQPLSGIKAKALQLKPSLLHIHVSKPTVIASSAW